MASQEFIRQVAAANDIVEVIQSYFPLERAGSNFKALSPFTQEKTPSFTVSEDKGFFHCFGCGAHGDVLAFVMQMDGLSFPEAVERLAGEAGLALPRADPAEAARAARTASLYPVLEAACTWFQAQLAGAAGQEARAYLHRRGIDDASIERFRLGFAPDARNALKSHLAAKGIDEAAMVEAGLVRAPDDGRLPYDWFRGRVIFPITDPRGRVIAFGGRVIGTGEPKYLNSPNSAVFHKGQSLYGLALARAAARDSGSLIVAEGYLDVIALHRAGLAHAVAPLGTALGEDQLALLWRLAGEPTLCFDGDEAGRRAAWRVAERALPLLAPGRSLRFAFLPPGDDPDSLVAADRAGELRAALRAARPLSDFIWEFELARSATDTPERRAAFRRRLVDLCERIGDRDLRRDYRETCEARFRKTFAPVYRRGRGRGRDPRRFDPGDMVLRAKALGDGPAGDVSRAERTLVATMVTHPELLDEFDEEFAGMRFRDPNLDRLKRDIITIWSRAPGIELERFNRHLADAGHAQTIAGFFARDDWSRPRVNEAFAQPGAPLEAARDGWRDCADRYRTMTGGKCDDQDALIEGGLEDGFSR